ncbi:hypothetical protein [Desulfatirhabdium butyrativorans]|uniref:hypothetical protein n=1 Tax=Desulfatirhabdium butyrativorans TaxID=340467 RepID=UPI000408A927|nr:hypothetical protein [Desulfatirhabdium butyrativorans]
MAFSTIEELDHLIELSVDPQDAVTRYNDADAMNDRIMEWFETPQGSIADLPSWGNTLAALQHEPISESLEVLMEIKILKKLSIDCGLQIQGLRLDFIDIDRIDIQIKHQYGAFSSEVARAFQ